jgi:hypothetical protein
MGWGIFFLGLFVLMAWGFYNTNKDKCEADAEEVGDMVLPYIKRAAGLTTTVVTAPFIKGAAVVKGPPNPEMDALKARQVKEMADIEGSATKYDDWWDDPNLYWNQEE